MPASRYSIGTAASEFTELTLPSLQNPSDPKSPHNVCLVRPLDPPMLMASGLLDQLDSLTALVNAQHIAPKQGTKVAAVQAAAAARKRKGKLPAASEPTEADGLQVIKDFIANKGDFNQLLGLMDRLVELAVVEPSVLRPVVRDESGTPVLTTEGAERPLPLKNRVPDQLYTDRIDLDDKSAIVSFVMGGVQALESFPGERSELVGDVE